jgi:alpha-mannosidase
MSVEELAILLPCHSLEDFPQHATGTQADGLLSGWIGLWHPLLLRAAGKLPTWHRADGPPSECKKRLMVVPAMSEPLLLNGWASRVSQEGAFLVRGHTDRGAVVDACLEALGPGRPPDPPLTEDFLALGYGVLMVELLTRRMRYMTGVDQVRLAHEALAAAEAVAEARIDEARSRLSSAFGVLLEARERFYSVDFYLLDLVRLAATTLGESLAGELASDRTLSLLASGRLLCQLSESAPATLAELVRAKNCGRASFVGGDWDWEETPLMPLETALESIRRGRAEFERWLGKPPLVYARDRFGMAPFLPQVIHKSGFAGAMHATFDEGSYPGGDQGKARWEGMDGTAVDCLFRLPLDASKPEAFLTLPQTIGESMDHDQVATVLFARWPGRGHACLEDLRRIAAYGNVLGRFVTADDYFSHTESSGRLSRFSPDQYRSAYLRQDVIRQVPQPISRIADVHREQAKFEAAATVRALAGLISETSVDEPVKAGEGEAEGSAARMARALPRSGEPQRGVLVINPLSFPRRELVDVSDLPAPPETGGTVMDWQEEDSPAEGQTRRRAIVQVPAMGYAWIAAGPRSVRRRASRSIARENRLENEELRVSLNPKTGGILSIFDTRHRDNHLSQQIAYRLPQPRGAAGSVWRDPDDEASYTAMRADSLAITANGGAYGEITSSGQLVGPEGETFGTYRQVVGLAHGSRVLMLDVEVDVRVPPRADPWNSYVAVRFAWGEEETEVQRALALAGRLTEARRIETSEYVELRSAAGRTAILPGGLPYHKRIGERMLDTLLIVRGETKASARMGVGINLTHPARAVQDLLTPPFAHAETAPPPASATGWLFHIDSRNVVVTHVRAVGQDHAARGFSMRLLETEGRGGRVVLSTFRRLASARQVDFTGRTTGDLQVEGEKVKLDLGPYEWMEVEGTWG